MVMALSANLRSALETIAAERPNFSVRCRRLVRQVAQEHGLYVLAWPFQSAADRFLADIPEDWPIAEVADLFFLAQSQREGGGLYWSLVRWLRAEDARKVHVALLNKVVGSIHNPQTYIAIARRFPQFKCECDVMVDECLRVWQTLKQPIIAKSSLPSSQE
jgi:hypothetical protein